METFKNKSFCLDSFEFLSSIVSFCDSIIGELKSLSEETYKDVFKETSESLKRTSKRIYDFIDKWESDDEQICRTLKSINEYYKYYCDTIERSTPALFKIDAKYISDSLNTSKLALNYRLTRIKEYITKNY